MAPLSFPNILVTGTPGTGKTTLCQNLINQNQNFHHFNISEIVKQEKLFSQYDKEFDTHLVDESTEDKICDYLEPFLEEDKGGCLVDFHSCAFFPENWFDLVVVLGATTDILYERLQLRNYSQKKITENVECEIMQVVLDEVRESYASEIIVQLKNDNKEDSESNLERILQWIKDWQKQHREII